MSTQLKLSPWQFSAIIHGIIFAFFISFNFISNETKNLDFTVLEYPTPTIQQQAPPQEPAKLQKKIIIPEKKAVFGTARSSLTSDTDQGENIKIGNTVAKEADNTKLNADDPESLPIPADEFLVSQMPSMSSDVIIPYPPEAKKRGIQGSVIMDLLIDASGNVRSVQVLEGPGFGLNEAAANAAKLFKFSPAKIGDEFVAVKIRYSYKFILEK